MKTLISLEYDLRIFLSKLLITLGRIEKVRYEDLQAIPVKYIEIIESFIKRSELLNLVFASVVDEMKRINELIGKATTRDGKMHWMLVGFGLIDQIHVLVNESVGARAAVSVRRPSASVLGIRSYRFYVRSILLEKVEKRLLDRKISKVTISNILAIITRFEIFTNHDQYHFVMQLLRRLGLIREIQLFRDSVDVHDLIPSSELDMSRYRELVYYNNLLQSITRLWSTSLHGTLIETRRGSQVPRDLIKLIVQWMLSGGMFQIHSADSFASLTREGINIIYEIYRELTNQLKDLPFVLPEMYMTDLLRLNMSNGAESYSGSEVIEEEIHVKLLSVFGIKNGRG